VYHWQFQLNNEGTGEQTLDGVLHALKTTKPWWPVALRTLVPIPVSMQWVFLFSTTLAGQGLKERMAALPWNPWATYHCGFVLLGIRGFP
jgi:hypothetical protein